VGSNIFLFFNVELVFGRRYRRARARVFLFRAYSYNALEAVLLYVLDFWAGKQHERLLPRGNRSRVFFCKRIPTRAKKSQEKLGPNRVRKQARIEEEPLKK
jgi:hypothetical protein